MRSEEYMYLFVAHCLPLMMCVLGHVQPAASGIVSKLPLLRVDLLTVTLGCRAQSTPCTSHPPGHHTYSHSAST
jgi:hypothetical protein